LHVVQLAQPAALTVGLLVAQRLHAALVIPPRLPEKLLLVAGEPLVFHLLPDVFGHRGVCLRVRGALAAEYTIPFPGHLLTLLPTHSYNPCASRRSRSRPCQPFETATH